MLFSGDLTSSATIFSSLQPSKAQKAAVSEARNPLPPVAPLSFAKWAQLPIAVNASAAIATITQSSEW